MFFRAILVASTAALSLQFYVCPAYADESERLFSCTIENTEADFIALNAARPLGDVGVNVQFSIERRGMITTQVPAQPMSGDAPFYLSNSDGPKGYYAQVRFEQDGRHYLLHMLDIPPLAGDENDMGGRAVGLTVTETNGVSYELGCGETEEYIGLMQEVMPCDMTNRYGADGCDFGVPPTRDVDDKLPPGYAPS